VRTPALRRNGGKAADTAAFPGRVVAYTAFLAASVIALGFAGASISHPVGIPWTSILPFIALLTAAECLIVRVHVRGQVLAITLFEAALAPLLFTAPTVAVIGVVAIAETITGVVRKNHPVKHAFNVVQFSAAAAVGSIVFQALGRATSSSPSSLLALALAMTSVAAVNIFTLSTVITLAERIPFRAVVQKLAPAMLFGWTVNTTFGLLFATAYVLSSWMLALFAVPMVLLYSAFKGHATALADRARLAGMHRATRALAGPVDPRDAIPQFLAEVRKCFDATQAELVLREGDVRVVHRVGRDGVPSYGSSNERWNNDPLAVALLATRQGAIVRAGDEGAAAAWLRTLGYRDCVAAPLVEGDHGLGVLRVYDRGGPEGFEQGGLAVLEALASEATRAMIKSQLLETILEERHKLAEIVGQTSDGILTLAPDGTIQTWNTALERITGFSAHEMVATQRLTELDVRESNGSPVSLERWAENDSLPADVQFTTRHGQVRWLSCSYTRVVDAEALPSTLIVVARDSTEAREVERLKDDFVATVSHELRTPLTPIKGWAATMLQLGGRLDDAQREEGVKAILRHADRLEQLITNILEVTKIERGLHDARNSLVDVGTVVAKVVDDFRTANSTRTIRYEATGAALRTRGDELWTEQIITNLVSNAFKYAPPSEPVDITVSQTGDRINVTVTDRGPGIPAHEMERIFERFKRLGDHMTRTTSGSGLGLYIARQLAHAVGGTLSVENTPGGGATFSLSLPAAQAQAPVSVAS
jgi:PAS domain S-box-containing protein